MGVWLPLALAQMYQALVFVASAYASKDSGLKVPTVAEALHAFGLPAMAEAARADQKANESNDAMDELIRLAKRTGGKVKVKGA